jgi:hypothetical protein
MLTRSRTAAERPGRSLFLVRLPHSFLTAGCVLHDILCLVPLCSNMQSQKGLVRKT